MNLSLRGGRFGPEGLQPFPTKVDIWVVQDAHTEVQRCERHGQNRPMRSGSTDVKKIVLQNLGRMLMLSTCAPGFNEK